MTTEGKSKALRAAVTLSAFIAGPLLGIALARLLAPSSDLSSVVSLLAFPLAFFIGMQLWLGMLIIAALASLVRMLFRRGKGTTGERTRNLEVPPGSFVFVPTAFLLAAAAGLITGILSRESSFILCLTTYSTAGLLFGVTLWQLALRGLLALLEEA
jgi:hypothetical protein